MENPPEQPQQENPRNPKLLEFPKKASLLQIYHGRRLVQEFNRLYPKKKLV
jgi:hypothetical protein